MWGFGNVHYVPAATGSDTSATGYAPPSSSGLGHHPFKVETAGSNPAGGTQIHAAPRQCHASQAPG